MSDAPFRLAPLNAVHDRAEFNSDSEPLNRYLREQVAQDIRRRVAACVNTIVPVTDIEPGASAPYHHALRITFDPAKRARTLTERGLDFADAREVFAGLHATLPDERRDYGEPRFISADMLQGRLVVLV